MIDLLAVIEDQIHAAKNGGTTFQWAHVETALQLKAALLATEGAQLERVSLSILNGMLSSGTHTGPRESLPPYAVKLAKSLIEELDRQRKNKS